MSLTRSLARTFRLSRQQPSTNITRPFTISTTRSISTTSSRLASGDYGSGDGDPKGSEPQSQGTSDATRAKEHPGPAPPAAGKGTSDGAFAGDSSGASSSSSGGGADSSKTKKTQGAQPKLSPSSSPGEHNEDVKKHNAEFEDRAERPHEKVSEEHAQNDKVDKGFW